MRNPESERMLLEIQKKLVSNEPLSPAQASFWCGLGYKILPSMIQEGVNDELRAAILGQAWQDAVAPGPIQKNQKGPGTKIHAHGKYGKRFWVG